MNFDYFDCQKEDYDRQLTRKWRAGEISLEELRIKQLACDENISEEHAKNKINQLEEGYYE